MAEWEAELAEFLRPFVEGLGHKRRREMCPVYIAGLIGPGERKSVQPMAARFVPGQYDRLHHFVSSGVWDASPLERELTVQADRLVRGADGYLVVDDTALPKKGDHSVGVAAQYASALGKTANCQSLVSLTLASREVPVMIGLRLFLPESWTNDPGRMAKARVPKARRHALTKHQIAVEEIDRGIASGARFGCVLADFRLRIERSVPTGLERARLVLGGRPVATPERLSRRCRADISRRQNRKAPQVPHPRHGAGRRRGNAGR